MSEKTIAQKLLIKEGRTVLLVNPPRGYKDTLGALPAGTRLTPGGPAGRKDRQDRGETG